MARALASEFAKITGQGFPIVNREGAAATIGFAALAAAKPDGYTVAISPNTPLTIAPHIIKSVAYTYDSFVPVCQSFENVMALFVGSASPYKTYQELVAAGKSQPGKFSWGTTGVGSVPHLSASAWLATAGLDAVHRALSCRQCGVGGAADVIGLWRATAASGGGGARRRSA
jgi:tripartite-type tricarboxylate transporter receptor subunit TctC